ncbi:hypothetical protein C900_05279 [Fulvivirga imtechensis AK7]|uniref:Uncharacterized protein n=1 Tax=Fulvivirga imtechensis AK7 TaxID=1237149 RepID=L8JLU7_9BACT|nr:pinensin family lanthipeptide [Fulvivirga imtechensis]ELR69208.1 hypothetical protein C900_05279 [Fulvivirga imtechensis AK7]
MKKLTLEKLRIKSFVTSIDGQHIKGGLSTHVVTTSVSSDSDSQNAEN